MNVLDHQVFLLEGIGGVQVPVLEGPAVAQPFIAGDQGAQDVGNANSAGLLGENRARNLVA